LHQQSFAEICVVFDEFDRQMKAGSLRYAVQWAESSLDVAFDSDSLDEYQAAAVSNEEMEALIDRTSYLEDNMDY
jgi:hypothetical protein